MRWNIHKTYLRNLRERGVRIVPPRWLERLDRDTLSQLFEEFAAQLSF